MLQKDCLVDIGFGHTDSIVQLLELIPHWLILLLMNAVLNLSSLSA